MALNTKQGWNWIASHQTTGSNIWISFSGGTPVVVPSSIDFFVTNGESGTSFSDDNGNLFLVSDGTTIKTSGGTTIVSGLSGSAFSMQSATILQSPYSSNTYYILTVGVGAAGTENGYGKTNQALTYNTLKYTGGTSPFFQVLNTNVEIGNRSNTGGEANYPLSLGSNGYGYAEVLTTALHQNGNDIWVITPNWGRNQIHSFLINSSGISGTPYTSTTAQVLQGRNNYGQIKPSPDYSKIAMVLGDSNASQVETANRPAVSIFDFNRSNGSLTNERVLLGNTGYTIYNINGVNPEVFGVGDVLGCEFSPDGNYLYVSEFQGVPGGKLLQFVLTASTPTSASTVTASTNYATFVQTGGGSLGTLHLAIDEKIYFTDRGTTRLYNVDNPNNPLSAVTISNFDYASGGGAVFNYGLPNIPLFANLPPVVTGCTDDNFCFNTSFPSLSAYSGNYVKQSTDYNGKNTYSGGTISAATVFYNGNKWCLSTSLGGSCILSGKQPCSTDCPDICDSVFDVSSCPTPTPTTTPTPTPTITPTPSVTMTNTPTKTNTPTTTQTNTPTPSKSRPAAVTFTISVTRTSPSPTPTQTPTSTPIPTRSVSSSGTSIYEIVNSPFICPGGNKVLTDCATGDEYVVSENISITGTTITRGTIFSAYINGISTCVTLTDYTDNSSNVVYGGAIAQFVSCINCLTPPTPSVTPSNTATPTQTPSVTPTITPTVTTTTTPTRTPTVTPTTSLPALGFYVEYSGLSCGSYGVTSGRSVNDGRIIVYATGGTGVVTNYRYSINSGQTFVSATTSNYSTFSNLSAGTYGIVVSSVTQSTSAGTQSVVIDPPPGSASTKSALNNSSITATTSNSVVGLSSIVVSGVTYGLANYFSYNKYIIELPLSGAVPTNAVFSGTPSITIREQRTSVYSGISDIGYYTATTQIISGGSTTLISQQTGNTASASYSGSCNTGYIDINCSGNTGNTVYCNITKSILQNTGFYSTVVTAPQQIGFTNGMRLRVTLEISGSAIGFSGITSGSNFYNAQCIQEYKIRPILVIQNNVNNPFALSGSTCVGWFGTQQQQVYDAGYSQIGSMPTVPTNI